jgi:hypothetical protein
MKKTLSISIAAFLLVAVMLSATWWNAESDAAAVKYAKPADGGACVVTHLDHTAKPARGFERAGADVHTPKTAKVAYDTVYLSPNGDFRVSYFRTGGSAVPALDSDEDGTPDYVEIVASSADSILSVYRSMGYTRPIHSGGGYQIRLDELSDEGVYGYAYNLPGLDNDYLQLDDDYSETLTYTTSGLDGMRVTLAHELFHVMQFTYVNYVSGNQWWMEATATSMEDVMYDDINDYHQYLEPYEPWGVLIYEDPSFALDNASEPGHMYGAAVFPHYLRSRWGDWALRGIQYTFEVQAEAGLTTAVIVGALESHFGSSIQSLLADFWLWSYFTGDRAIDGWFFPDAADYYQPPNPSRIATDDWVLTGLSDKGTVVDTITTQHLGGWLIRVVPEPGKSGGVRISLSDVAPYEGKLAWRVGVVTTAGDSVTFYDPVGGIVDVNWSDASDIVIGVANGSLYVPLLESFGTYMFRYNIQYNASITTGSVGVAKTPLPEPSALGQNYPNPFNPSTTIPVVLSESASVSLVVYDANGRRVRTLASRALSAGQHSFTWDGTTDIGRPAGTGTYIARLVTPTGAFARRLVLVR